MLINLRNALMGGKRLPYDAEVEYLESTGTQRIDTGFAFSAACSLSASISFTPSSAENDFFGAYKSTDENKMVCGCYQKFVFLFNPPGTRVDSSTLGDAEVYANIQCSFTGSSSGGTRALTINGNTYTQSGAYYNNREITLFRSNFSGIFKCYSFKIYDANGTLVRDYIPVRKGTVGYLYDRVSGKLFGNAGTGDFVLGPDVVPVEYIESHGTEWIDTDKSADLPIHLEADINFTNPNTGSNVQTFVGGYNAGQANQRFWVTSLPQGKINCGLLTNSISADLVPSNRKVHLVVDFEDGRQTATIDGVQYTSASQSTTNYWFRDWKLRIFQTFGTVIGHNNIPLQAITNRIDIDIGASQALRLRPVRIGSGSTWEGAMMDVLTRRIYRNAGTGAFTYGNDLKYPIPAE